MTTETTTTVTCDVCGEDVRGALMPWPMSIRDAGGAVEDICSERCLLDLAVRLIENEARAHERRVSSTPLRAKKAWWQR